MDLSPFDALWQVRERMPIRRAWDCDLRTTGQDLGPKQDLPEYTQIRQRVFELFHAGGGGFCAMQVESLQLCQLGEW